MKPYRDKRIRVMIAEDNPYARKGLSEFVDSENDFKVVAEVGTGSELVTHYFLTRTDVVIVNPILPDMNGMEAIESIMSEDRKIKALFLSDINDESLMYRILKCGGMGYVVKQDPVRILLNSIREVNSGELCFPEDHDEIFKRCSGEKAYTGYENHELQLILSKKEYEIFLLCGSGLSSREIADKLLVGIKTVDYHLNNIREKLNLRHRNQLIRISARHNLLYNQRYKFK